MIATISAAPPAAHAEARARAAGNLKRIAPRLPFALIAAACLGRLLPPDLVFGWIGAGSSLPGLPTASVVGALRLGGPMLAFPLAIALIGAGAGPKRSPDRPHHRLVAAGDPPQPDQGAVARCAVYPLADRAVLAVATGRGCVGRGVAGIP